MGGILHFCILYPNMIKYFVTKSKFFRVYK